MPDFKNDPVTSDNDTGDGIKGTTRAPFAAGVSGISEVAPDFVNHQDPGPGVLGQSQGTGVVGLGTTNHGVFGHSAQGPGVAGESDQGHGVVGQAHGDAFGVIGLSDKNTGVVGESVQGHGVVGQGRSDVGFGVFGLSDKNTGVVGQSKAGAGVVGDSQTGTGVLGIAHAPDAIAVRGQGGKFAGFFDGDVNVQGTIIVKGDVQLIGADVAEQFDVVGDILAEPGCVVVLAGDDQVRVSDTAYDRKVAGVVSGAGTYRPALVLDQREGITRRALALTGKVWCKVDANYGSVSVGDMLTTSATAGHAMRATDTERAFGAVVGKALGGLEAGRGLIAILVALQ